MEIITIQHKINMENKLKNMETEVEKAEIQTGTYTCPMHPEIIKNELGSCPICGMTLIPMQPK